MSYDRQREEREFRQNPPAGAPGQSSDGWGDDLNDIFDSLPEGSSSAEETDPYANQDINKAMEEAIGGTNQQNTQQNNQQGQYPMPMQGKSAEDVIMDATIQAGKGIGYYVMYLVKSLKDNTHGDWHRLGVRIMYISIGCGIVGLFFTVLNLFLRTGNKPIDLVIGSLVSMMVGICFSMFFDKDDEITEDPSTVQEQDDNTLQNFDTSSEYEESEEVNFEDEGLFQDESEDGDWASSFMEDEENSWETFDVDDNSVSSENFVVDDAINKLPEITKGTQTRQYLYETFISVLPLMNPTFSTMVQISDTKDEFFEFEDLLRGAAYQVGTKEECIPELQSLYENDFIFRLNCSRPIGIKEQAIADEVASAFSRDGNNRVIRNGCYATIETSVGMYTINIFKGTEVDYMGQSKGGAMISLGDVYRVIKDFICNTDIEIPFVWGINEFGDPIYCDMKDNNSIIISGEPRGGKSWKGQSIIAQLAMFHSPKEIEFYFFDGKNKASDYRYLSTVLPHAKYFCGDMDKINDGLDRVINLMIEDRGKKITEAGCINIKDYNKSHPNDKIPYTYVVIDELQSLMGHFIETDQKEEGNKFRSYLSTMVSKLPYTGIRFILFPHRIVNDVISKNTYSLVSCRAVVRQTNFGEVKNAMDVTEKTFPYKLAQTGDMAIKVNEIAGGTVSYCHSEVLTKSNNDNKKLFDYIGGVWRKLEPDCKCIEINGSIGGNIGNVKPKANKVARDNSFSSEDFQYTGFDTGSSVGDLPEEMFENEGNDDLDADSDFWDSFGN